LPVSLNRFKFLIITDLGEPVREREHEHELDHLNPGADPACGGRPCSDAGQVHVHVHVHVHGGSSKSVKSVKFINDGCQL